MVEVSAEIIDQCKKWLKKESDLWTTAVCRGTTTRLDKWQEMAQPHTACHSWLTYAFGHVYRERHGGGYWGGTLDYNNYIEGAEPFLAMTCHSKVRAKYAACTPEACDFLVRWMANESPFSEFILNRDDDKSLTEGGVILLCGPGGLNLQQAMWVFKVLRFVTEGANAPDTFMKLVQGGVDGMLAVYVASHIRSLKGATFGYTGPYGHMSVVGSGGYNEADVIGMFQRNLNPTPNNTASVFIMDKDKIPPRFNVPKTYEPIVRDFCKPFQKPDGWGGFVNGEGADTTALVERTLAWQAELQVCLSGANPKSAPVPKMPDSNTVYLDLDL